MKHSRNLIVGLVGTTLIILGYWSVRSIKMVDQDEVLVLVRRYFGDPLPPHKTVADPGEKGPQRKALGPGFHFVPAWIYATEKFDITRIPQGMIGIKIARSGEPLPPGTVIADEGQKGIRADILKTGDHRVNPYEFDVEIVPAVEVPSGKVGVLVQLTGDPLPDDEIIARAEEVEPGSKTLPRSKNRGVLEHVLPPGTYYVNSYMYHVELHDEVVVDAGSLGVQIRKAVSSRRRRVLWSIPFRFAGQGKSV